VFTDLKVYTLFANADNMQAIQDTRTDAIVEALTRAIVAHRLRPGEKLGEQKLADQFGVSRSVVRQALNRLSQNRLVTLSPARGASVTAPSAREAQQVFAVRRMLEAGMVRTFVAQASDADLRALEAHLELERAAVERGDVPGRTDLLGDFHVYMALLMGNQVLADALRDLISRCALITLMYQTPHAAAHSLEEHGAIVAALRARDVRRAVRRMDAHLLHVEKALDFQPETAPEPHNTARL